VCYINLTTLSAVQSTYKLSVSYLLALTREA